PHARRRQQLINATVRVIARHGLSKTTVARVAKAANLSAGIVSFYFQGKDELLLATLEHLDREFGEAVQTALASAGDDPAAALLVLIDVYFDPELADPRKVAVWFSFWGESRAREDYLRICGDADREFDQTVRSLLSSLPGLDEKSIAAHATALVGMLDSLWQNILWEGDDFDRAAAKDLCRDFLGSIAAEAFPRVTKTHVSEPAQPLQTLPPWTYRSEAFFELEQQHLFKRHWLLVGHSCEMPQVGDYLTF
ncbi:MAG: transcriptional regulator BetI, partial [Pseudomonas stutzeri]|nr:transcriptional regulator BetI [Stutzerimonas stutzeri]